MFGSGAAPIVVLIVSSRKIHSVMSCALIIAGQNTKRDTGRKVQRENIQAGKAIADVIRTCLGPQAMLKMLMDPMGGIVMTNDGNAILREITVQHPAGKSMIEIARTQDEEVGDALEDMVAILNEQVSIDLDCNDRSKLIQVINSCVGTKFIGRWCVLACQIALDAVYTVMLEENGRREIDIKRYAKVEKIPGGTIEDSTVLKGVMFNKDVTHPKMRRHIKNPRIVLLDCSLEYKKGESQTNIEIMKDTDFTRILELEEEFVKKMCEDIISVKPDVVITEKGVSDLAQHYLVKAGISAIRRLRKSDINRIARACGATVVNRTEELREEDVGTRAGLFEIKKLGDEYFCFITECKDPKACTIILRGASKDDALHVARNLLIEPKLVPGGGAVEMAVSRLLTEKAARLAGVEQWPYKAVAQALEIIPRTLAQNCGANTIRTLTALRAKHATEGMTWGIDGETGQLVDMKERGIWEPLSVKLQTYKTAIETAILLLRIDDIVSGSKKKKSENEPAQPAQVSEESMKD
ncbi:T-complex protein 1 subunit gamma [Melipona quadrifasciata]|uniref:T-complex protein 1 subunit gamma n=1 Tax=Melipona quadrifasciata TaxID=166423 RepID=A0A0N0U613_9HYME|nr:T-complex protein 1 subunit gamma [Melipona quadrifasciata]